MAHFFNTTRSIICEAGSSNSIGKMMVDRLRSKRCLVVTDKPLRALGLLDEPLKSLQNAGLDTIIFDNVVADPPESVVLEATEVARAAKVDSIIGFGGGSPMDVAKLVAYLAGPTTQRLDEIWGVEQCDTTSRLPLVQVPTTAGTGSEVTPVAIVTTGATTKMGVVSATLLPDLAVLDAGLTLGLPPHITAATGMDAMVHATEAYTSNIKKNPVSDVMAQAALRLLSKNLRAAVMEGSDLKARENMLLGSTLAGMAFANAPVAAVHALAYPIGGIFKVPHGLSCSLMFTPVLRFNAEAAEDLYVELAPCVLGDADDATLPPTERVQALIEGIEGLAADVGLPKHLAEVGVQPDDVARMASDAMLQTRLLVNNPVEVTEAHAVRLYNEIGGW